jgi:hypothetical protein
VEGELPGQKLFRSLGSAAHVLRIADVIASLNSPGLQVNTLGDGAQERYHEWSYSQAMRITNLLVYIIIVIAKSKLTAVQRYSTFPAGQGARLVAVGIVSPG